MGCVVVVWRNGRDLASGRGDGDGGGVTSRAYDSVHMQAGTQGAGQAGALVCGMRVSVGHPMRVVTGGLGSRWSVGERTDC